MSAAPSPGLRRFVATLLLVAVVALLTACEPRGETRSVDEVLRLERTRYVRLVERTENPQLRQVLDGVNGALDSLLETAAQAQKAEEVAGFGEPAAELAKALSTLVNDAGYTARPSIFELANQYRHFAGENGAQPSTIKLLVARTYTILASELESTAFGVGGKA